jgi:hypothetical protein
MIASDRRQVDFDRPQQYETNMRMSFAALLLSAFFSASLCAAQEAAINIKPQALPATLYCTDEYDRRVLVDIDVPATGLTLRTTPDNAFETSVKIISPKQAEIRLRALKPGHGTMELRGPKRDAQGQIIGTEAVVLRHWDLQVVEINTNIFKTISPVATLPDGSDVFGGEIILSPHVPGIDIRFICLNSQVIVVDGMGERWCASETFTRIPATGNSMTSFRMVRPKNAQWVPFTCLLYQDGEQLEAP